MSLVNKEILEKRILEVPLDFINLVPKAYNIAISYIEFKSLYKKHQILAGIDILDIDELEESCILYIENINKKIIPSMKKERKPKIIPFGVNDSISESTPISDSLKTKFKNLVEEQEVPKEVNEAIAWHEENYPWDRQSPQGISEYEFGEMLAKYADMKISILKEESDKRLIEETVKLIMQTSMTFEKGKEYLDSIKAKYGIEL